MPSTRDNGQSIPQIQARRRPGDDRPAARVARLAWFELAAAATRRELALSAAATGA